MGVGHKSMAEARSASAEGAETPNGWVEREVLHAFEDGWTVELLTNEADRTRENHLLWDGRACINERVWNERLETGAYLLASLRDPNGEPHATLMFGEANWVIEKRADYGYTPYASARAFDQAPRCFGSKAVIALQCCPKGYMAGDTAETTEYTQRVKAWYEALPLAENFDGFRCDDPNMRTACSDWLRERKVEYNEADTYDGGW
jgi:hypothetical protein